MKTYSIATIPGDGIGKEVVPAGQQVLEALAIGQDWDGDVRVVLFVRLKDGATLDDALEALESHGGDPLPEPVS